MNINLSPFKTPGPRTECILAGLIILAMAACLLMGAYLFGAHTAAPKLENTAPAAAQSQADGSVILARMPQVEASTTAPHQIPKDAVEERRISVTVKPTPHKTTTPPADQSSPQAQAQNDCAPVTVDLSLIRQNGGRRVVASSPDGLVVGGLDIPIESALLPADHPWAAGLSVGHDKSPGVWLERDLGRIRLGAEALRQRDGDLQARLRVGWSW